MHGSVLQLLLEDEGQQLVRAVLHTGSLAGQGGGGVGGRRGESGAAYVVS